MAAPFPSTAFAFTAVIRPTEDVHLDVHGMCARSSPTQRTDCSRPTARTPRVRSAHPVAAVGICSRRPLRPWRFGSWERSNPAHVSGTQCALASCARWWVRVACFRSRLLTAVRILSRFADKAHGQVLLAFCLHGVRGRLCAGHRPACPDSL